MREVIKQDYGYIQCACMCVVQEGSRGSKRQMGVRHLTHEMVHARCKWRPGPSGQALMEGTGHMP